MRQSEDLLEVSLNHQDERATAFGRSVAFMRQAYPNMAAMTYDNRTARGAEHLVLVKFVLGIGEEKKILSYQYCTEETTANNVPGGLESKAVTLDGHTVQTGIYPVILPEEDLYRGAFVIHVKSDMPGVFLRFGCGNVAFMHHSPNAAVMGEAIDCEEGSAAIAEDAVVIRHGERDFVTYVRGNMDFSICQKETGGSYAEGYTTGDEVWLMIGFSVDETEACRFSALEACAEMEKVADYYRRKLENLYIHTPDKELDASFMHAYLNLEYSWLYPFGWIECIQHWPTLFHMEQTAAEEWAGNFDRTKETLRSQLQYMRDDGAILELHPNHTARRDWGGDNHFFVRELLHYLQMTGDLDFARECQPYIEKIIRQTFGEYDATRTGILAWHSQIGNQEDFESTPGRGAAPGSEGVQMLSLAADYFDILGECERAQAYRALSAYCLEAWKKRIWKKDLGRAIWFSDDYGQARLDTTYHGICYPIIYGQVDSFDAQSSMDHLMHRMTGEEGEVFQSNHFGDHRFDWVPTWGMQAGSDMQPFATAAYAKIGKHEAAIRPLDFVATRVCGDYQRGSFPETANETRFGYFSPSAGVFAQGVIESIFGVTRDLFANVTTISPCFPGGWEHAALRTPIVNYTYQKQGNSFTIAFRSADTTQKKLLWRTDFVKNVSVCADGKPVACHVAYECGFCIVSADLGCASDVICSVAYQPIAIALHLPAIAVCGEKPHITAEGAEIIGIADRCGVLDEDGAYRTDLLDAYVGYGDFGLVNFARRTFAVRLRHDGIVLSVPCSVTVVPPYRMETEYAAHTVTARFWNRTGKSIDSDAYLMTGSTLVKSHLCCGAGESAACRFEKIPDTVPGKNRAMLHIGGVFSGEILFTAPMDTAQTEQLTIPDDLTVAYPAWRDMAYFPHHGCTVINPDAFLRDMPDKVEIGGLAFTLNGRFAPVATRENRVLHLPIARAARKLFVLFSAFADDHEICSEPFDAEIVCEKEGAYLLPVYRKTLCFPGDLDYGFGAEVVADFSTYKPGAARPSVLPPLGETDYADTVPPVYPTRDLWCKNHAVEVGNTVLNLLEFDLGETRTIKELTLLAKASDAAGGVFGIAIC